MPTREAVIWFKEQFQVPLQNAVKGTPFSVDMLTAIACQETGYIWNKLRTKNLPLKKLLELCVGDTLDSGNGRRAFPKTKEELLSVPKGEEMYNIARQSLLDMAEHIDGYKSAARVQNKFCHGFGIFQMDLQHFRTDPDYFLQKQYTDFDVCAQRCVGELNAALRRICWHNKTSLTDEEMACVGIAYNAGSYKPERKLKQGYLDKSSGRFYGEFLFDYIRLAKSVSTGTPPGTAFIAPPTQVNRNGIPYEVNVIHDALRLRSEPVINPAKPRENVIAMLPDGHQVFGFTGKKIHGFIEVETNLNGAYFRGYAAADYLKNITNEETSTEEKNIKQSAIPPAYYLPKDGSIVKRTSAANALSLNEPGQPSRTGTTPAALRDDLTKIIKWLQVDNEKHLRYYPYNNSTFCNVYAHDYCYLAGVYLPRVWWTSRALLNLNANTTPKYDSNITEMRANDLFQWLRDFGLLFGWRQTGTLSKLQLEVNQGGIGLICAKRREDGRSGHISVVVPETEEFKAKRNSSGDVIVPLQSQAGIRNFRYSAKNTWWLDDRFSDNAFWIHS